VVGQELQDLLDRTGLLTMNWLLEEPDDASTAVAVGALRFSSCSYWGVKRASMPR